MEKVQTQPRIPRGDADTGRVPQTIRPTIPVYQTAMRRAKLANKSVSFYMTEIIERVLREQDKDQE